MFSSAFPLENDWRNHRKPGKSALEQKYTFFLRQCVFRRCLRRMIQPIFISAVKGRREVVVFGFVVVVVFMTVTHSLTFTLLKAFRFLCRYTVYNRDKLKSCCGIQAYLCSSLQL